MPYGNRLKEEMNMPKIPPREEHKVDRAFASLVGAKVYGNDDFDFPVLAKYVVKCSPALLKKWTIEISSAPLGKAIRIAKMLGMSKEDVINALWQ